MLAQHPSVVISVSDCHAVVSRYRSLPDGALTCERACNAEELEADALAALVAQPTPVTCGGHYPCPPDLVVRAVWPDCSPRILLLSEADVTPELRSALLAASSHAVLSRTPASLNMAELELLQPDLVLVDWRVDQHELGWRTCKWIKYHPPTAHLPLIVCAAATPAVLEVEGVLRSQGLVVVYKPFALAELRAAIEAALHQTVGLQA